MDFITIMNAPLTNKARNITGVIAFVTVIIFPFGFGMLKYTIITYSMITFHSLKHKNIYILIANMAFKAAFIAKT